MRFPSVIDMHMAGNQRQRHVCVSDITKLRLIYANVIYHFAPMGGVSDEQEYPTKALEIIVLTLTKAK